MINDLLIEQEVLKLQDKLLFLMMNRLFTCKIKEHKDFTLAPLWSKSVDRSNY